MLHAVVRTVQRIRNLVDQVVDVLAEAGPGEMPAALGEIARAQTFGETRLRLPSDPSPQEAQPPPAPSVPPPPPAPRKADPERTLSMLEVSKVLGISLYTAREHGRRGRIPVVKVGRKVRVRESSLKRLLEKRERGS